MTSTTLGTEQAAIATLLSAVNVTQASIANTEVDISFHPGPVFGFANASDPLFNALLAQTVIGRLDHEDPLHPSAIIMDRSNGTKGATCVQVAFTNVAQVPYFVAASNWLATLAVTDIGRLEVMATTLPSLESSAGANFRQAEAPLVGINGRGTVTAKAGTTQSAGVGTAAVATGNVTVDTISKRTAGTLHVDGAGNVAVSAVQNQVSKMTVAGKGTTVAP